MVVDMELKRRINNVMKAMKEAKARLDEIQAELKEHSQKIQLALQEVNRIKIPLKPEEIA